VSAEADTVLDHAACDIGYQNAVTRTEPHQQWSRSLLWSVSSGCRRLLAGSRSPAQPATVCGARTSTGPGWLSARAGAAGAAGAEGTGQVAAPRSPALPCAAVAASVLVVYASFGTGAEPQVLGVASSAPRAEELAERYAEQDRCGWRRSDWLEWDSARRVRPAVNARGNAVGVWLIQVGLDELTRFVLQTEPLLEENNE
jgi:hypothetical protein